MLRQRMFNEVNTGKERNGRVWNHEWKERLVRPSKSKIKV